VIEVRAATESETATWRDDWRHRLESWYRRPDVTASWADQQIENKLASHQRAAVASTFALASDGAVTGYLAAAVVLQGGQPMAMISDVWVAPPHRRRGHASAALHWAQSWAKSQGANSIWAVTNPAEPAHAGLFAGYKLRAQQMIKKLSSPGALADGLAGRPMTEDEFAGWRAAAVRGYAADIAGSGVLSAQDAAGQAAAQFDQLLPAGLSTANHVFLCLQSGTETVATNWICLHRAPGAGWVYGVEVSEPHRGRGYGRAAMVIGEQATLDAGDTHLALNVFGQNAVAISLYDSMGYRAFDQARSMDL
jgi:GNAT superfamily N-acetyltransferase